MDTTTTIHYIYYCYSATTTTTTTKKATYTIIYSTIYNIQSILYTMQDHRVDLKWFRTHSKSTQASVKAQLRQAGDRRLHGSINCLAAFAIWQRTWQNVPAARA